MSRKRLPPYGQEFASSSSNNPWVAIGSGAWDFKEQKAFPVMVLPPDHDPAAYTWPVAGLDVLLVEWGDHETDYLELVALTLLRSGARLVATIREANLVTRRMSPIYYREAIRAAA